MPHTKSAITILVLLVTSIYLYQQRYTTHDAYTRLSRPGSTSTMAEDSLLSNLKISIRQVSSSSPVSIAITVKNTNSHPVTILPWDSPLDPLALQLGAISVTPPGSSTPLDIPTIKVNRKLPAGDDFLVEIGAGETSPENVVELKEIFVGQKLRELQVKKALVKCKGQWRAVWAVPKKELSPETIEGMGVGDDTAASGNFESEEFEFVLQ